MRKARWLVMGLLVLVVAALAVATTASGSHKSTGISGKLSITGVWTSVEQKSFLAVIAAFNKKFPDVKVTYTSAGNNTPTVLATAIQGGHPPDLAEVAQPAFVRELAKKGSLKPITFAKATIAKNYGPGGVTLGTVNGTLYSLFFKASNKSTVWYNVS